MTSNEVWDDGGRSHSVPDNVFVGKVEELSKDFLMSGLLKVRVPVLHGDTPLKRIPWARVTDTLRAHCIEWDSPKGVPIEKVTISKGKLSGQLSTTGTCSCSLSSGSVTIERPFMEKDVSGEFEAMLQPKKHTLSPYANLRDGDSLLRVGDSVLVYVLNGNGVQLAVTEIFKMGG